MSTHRIQTNENKKERIISGCITFIISVIVLILIFLFKTTYTTVNPPSYIDINFQTDELGANYGQDEVGLGDEEPADQDVLLGNGGDPLAENISSNNDIPDKQEPIENKKYLTDASAKDAVSTPIKKTEKLKKKTEIKKTISSNPSNSKNSDKSNGKNGNQSGGNPKGNAALGALLKGKGTSTSSKGEGTGGKPGQNQGVETGGSGSGGVGIGNGRKLVSWIPGTNGKSGKAPVNNCTESGTITFSYTVNKNGDVTSVERTSGKSNTCMVNAGKKWIKEYVKAEKANSISSGTYKINF